MFLNGRGAFSIMGPVGSVGLCGLFWALWALFTMPVLCPYYARRQAIVFEGIMGPFQNKNPICTKP